EDVAATIDLEVRGLIEAAHDEAWEILVEYRDVLDDLVLRLMDKETISKEAVMQVFAPVRKRPSRGSYTGAGKRLPSDKPPVMTPRELALLGSKDVPGLTRSPSGNGSGGGPSAGAKADRPPTLGHAGADE
ncbi:MAG: cell division protein FtsH, partial [Mycobacterium leprae]